MDQNQRRAVRQKLARQQKLEGSEAPRYVNRYGMTPAEIHKAVKKQKDNNQLRLINRTTRAKRNRPVVVSRQDYRPNKNLLLEVPNVATQLASRYPTPGWFSFEGKADISIIIPLYKSSSVIKDLIASWDLDEPLNAEIIYVDDACPLNSKEAVVRLWEKRRPELKRPVGRIYYSPQNQGFGTSCNIGAMHATGDYLIFLNADTVVTPGWIRPMVRLLKKTEVGVVGNLQLQHGGMGKDTVDSIGSEWNWHDFNFTHMGKYIYNGHKLRAPFTLDNAPKEIFEVQEREMVTGSCIAIRKDLYERIGGFNPNYRIGYWEDSELCMTVREKGYKVMYQPSSKIYHKVGHSQSGGHKYQQHNTNYFRNKWVTSGRIDPLVRAPRPEPMKPVGSILLKRSAAHGDVLVAAAVAPALKKKYPGCRIMFNTLCPDVLAGNPYIDKMLSAHELSGRTFDIFYNLDMAYEFRPKSHLLEAYADAVGVKTEDCQLHLTQEKISGLPDHYVVLHAAVSSWVGRTLPSASFEAITQRLLEAGHHVVTVGGGRDFVPKGSINFVGRTNSSQLAYLIANAKLFVGVDSYPFHVAQTFQVPGVCFFGSIDPKLRLIGKSIKPVYLDGLPCLGCHHRKPAPSTVTNVCDSKEESCVKLSTDQIMHTINEVLCDSTLG